MAIKRNPREPCKRQGKLLIRAKPKNERTGENILNQPKTHRSQRSWKFSVIKNSPLAVDVSVLHRLQPSADLVEMSPGKLARHAENSKVHARMPACR